jgi:PAS domain S-box-containing protein
MMPMNSSTDNTAAAPGNSLPGHPGWTSLPGSFRALLVAALVGFLAGGIWAYRAQEAHLRHTAALELEAITNLKLRQVADWRAEELAEGTKLMASPFFVEAVARWLAQPQPETTQKILEKFRSLHSSCGYRDVILADPDGKVRLRLNGLLNPLEAEPAQALSIALRNHKPELTELYLDAGRTPQLDVVAPVYVKNGTGETPAAVVVLQCNLAEYFYPLLRSWPTPSRTAESLLVRRDGDSVLFLNDLRSQTSTALKYSIPLSQTNMTVIQVVSGRRGVYEGLDYRGQKVLAAMQPVPDSNWFMVAKLDLAEAIGDWRRHSLVSLGLLLTLVSLLCATGLIVWQVKQKSYYRELYRTLAERHELEQRNAIILRSMGDAVIATDVGGRITLLNATAESLTGWTRDQAEGKPLEDVFQVLDNETRQRIDSPVEKVLREGVAVALSGETVLISRDGTERVIGDSAAPVRGQDEKMLGVVLVFREETEERAAQRSLQESEARYRSLFQNMLNGAAYCRMHFEAGVPQDFTYLAVNDSFGKLTGLENVVGRKISEIIPGIREKDPALFEIYGKVAHTGVPEHLETYIEALGDWYNISIYSPAREHFVVVFDIVTERKRAEEALRASELLNRSTLNSLSANIAILDHNGTIVAVNLAWRHFAKNNPPIRGNVFEGANYFAACDKATGEDADSAKAFAEGIRGVMAGWQHEFSLEYPCHSAAERRWFLGRVTGFSGSGGRSPWVVVSHENLTARKLAEEALQTSERRLRFALEQSQTGGWEFDVGGDTSFVTPEHARIFGYDKLPTQWSFHVFLEHVVPEDRDGVQRRVQEAIKARTNWSFECRICRADGVVRWIWVSGGLQPGAEGAAGRAGGVVQDITSRKQAEEALRESEEQFRTMFDLASVGIAQADPSSGRWVRVNRKMCDITGYSANEMLQHSVSEVTHPDDRHEDWEAFQRVVRGEAQDYRKEKRYIRKDGSVAWVNVNMTILRDPAGVPTRTMAVVEDISERKRVEQQLDDHVELLGTILDHAPIGFAVNTINDGVFQYVNARFEEIYGLPHGVVRSVDDFFELVYPDPAERGPLRRQIKSDIESRDPARMHWENVRFTDRNGEKRVVTAVNIPLLDQNLMVSTVTDVTQRLQAEDAVRAREEQLRLVTDHAPVLLAHCDREKRFKFVNRPYAEMFGLQVADILGKHVRDLLGEKTYALVRPNMEAALAGQSTEYEIELTATVYGPRTVHVGYAPERDASGLVIGFVAATVDVTERKRAEEKLWASEVRYRRVLESMRDAFAVVGMDGRIQEFNRVYRTMLGYPEDELKRLTYEDVTPPRWHEVEAKIVRDQVLMRGFSDVYEKEYRRRNGTVFPVELRTSLIRDASGEPLAMWAIIRDITERKKAEADLRESEVRFRTLVETAPEAIFLQVDSCFAYVNGATLQLLGAAHSGELLGRPVLERVHPDSRDLVRERIRLVNEARKPAPTVEFVYLKLDGSPVQVSVTAVPFEYRERFGALVFARDITERKRLEAERTAMETQSRQHQRLEAIGTLASGVAHEINNPINGVMNYAQLILDESEAGSSHAEFASEIIRETQRVAVIVRNLLQFSRHERQVHSPAEIGEIVGQTISLIRTVIRHDQIVLQVNVPPGLPRLNCQSQQIQQVLMNLLTNARDALNEKYPGHHDDKIIHLNVASFTREGQDWVRFTVEDHGTGIPAEIRERIYDPFFTTKGRDKGTGLGLSISHGILKEHHGRLRHETELGQWTRLHVELPMGNE